jgi:hypothetical protein
MDSRFRQIAEVIKKKPDTVLGNDKWGVGSIVSIEPCIFFNIVPVFFHNPVIMIETIILTISFNRDD